MRHGPYSPDYQAPQPDARLWSAGHTERNGGSKKESRAWAAESRASAVTPGRGPIRNAPGSRSRGRFTFCARNVGRVRRIGPWPGRPPEAAFGRGFWALAPLWLGVVPFGVAYAITARGAGLSLLETQALSVLVFAGSAQLSAVGLFAAGAAGLEIVLTTLLLNVRHVLYGVALVRELPLTRRQRPAAAFFLTDEAFGVVAAARERSFPFLLGAELSLFVMWNLATLAGFLLGAAIPDPEQLGVDLIFPLAFLALLVPLVRTRVELAVAARLGSTRVRARPRAARAGCRSCSPGSAAASSARS